MVGKRLPLAAGCRQAPLLPSLGAVCPEQQAFGRELGTCFTQGNLRPLLWVVWVSFVCLPPLHHMDEA